MNETNAIDAIDYAPKENALVYVAAHKDQRGKGIGKTLSKKTLKLAKGDVALHVGSGNPARFLYKKICFNKLNDEIRFKRTSVIVNSFIVKPNNTNCVFLV